jgi:DNA-binding Lrp family transcriptional regulator
LPNPDKPRKKGIGGPAFHKNPECPCNACTARRRKAETLAWPNGAGGNGLGSKNRDKAQAEVINADAPMMIPGRTARDRVAQLIMMRQQEPGIKNAEVARRLGLTANGLNSIIYRATRDGWLKYDDPISRIEYEIIPKVIDNISEFLDKKDKTVTIETAKGTIFKQFQDSKGISDGNQTVLALKIESAEPSKVQVVTGHIVGKPKIVEITEVPED